jgi:integrase
MKRPRKIQRDKRNGNYFVWLRRQGVRKYFNLGANRREAERLLRQTEAEISGGKIQFAEHEPTQAITNGKPDIRIEELIVEYLENASLDKSTLESRKFYLNDFYSFVGECMVSDITFMKLSHYLSATKRRLIKKAKKNHPDDDQDNQSASISRNAGKTHLRHVKTLLRWGVDAGLCTLSFKKFPQIKIYPSKKEGFTMEEIKKILSRCDEEDFNDLITFAMLTGPRPDELRRLTTDILTLGENGTYCFKFTEHKTFKHTKKERWVALSPEAYEIVQRQIAKHPKSKYIFLNDDGKPYTAGTLRQRLLRWCRRAGVQDLPPYALRHTFARYELKVSGNLRRLQELMNHSDIKTTVGYCSDVPEECQEEVDKYGKYIRENLLSKIQSECKVDAKCATKCATDKKAEIRSLRQTSRRALQTKARKMVGTAGFEPATSAV